MKKSFSRLIENETRFYKKFDLDRNIYILLQHKICHYLKFWYS
jgi:hypothetical protein